jgi:hypothetical protein
MVALVWIIIAAVVLVVGTLLGLMDRRGRRQGHTIRRASDIAVVEWNSRNNVRRRRPRVAPAPPQTRNKYPKL